MGKIVYVSIGSNLGNRLQNLNDAIEQMQLRAGAILKVSRVIVTPPWGFEADTPFLNACLKLETELVPEELLNILLSIENKLGRMRTKTNNYASRPIDLDIIDYEGITQKSSSLELPHPRYTERKFVLLPLAEIAPEFMDIKTAKPIQQLLDECPDESSVSICESNLSFNQ